jgi:hypothetical protein
MVANESVVFTLMFLLLRMARRSLCRMARETVVNASRPGCDLTDYLSLIITVIRR